MAGRDNVILLTQGVVLPAEPLMDEHLEIIANAISSAWQSMVADRINRTTQGQERDVNATLVSQLRLALRRRSRFKTLVHHIEKGAECHSYDGRKIELRPDISFSLTRRSEYPLLGECKIIDKPSRKTIGLYNTEGVRRFVDGDYAWYANQGFMIAYVRDGTQADMALRTMSRSLPQRWPAETGRHFRTTHERAFNYIDRNPTDGVPGAIDLVHIWLS